LPTTTTTTPVSGDPPAPITSVVLGATVSDTAVVAGSAAGGDPTGTVDFFVCGPIASPGLCGAGGAGLGSVGLVSDGNPATFTSSATSAGFTPTSPGRYCFRAVYGGDTNYTGSSDSASNECFVVVDKTSVATAQKWTPNDSATVTAAGGSNLNGSVDFSLHLSSNCSDATPLYTQSIPLVNATSPAPAATTNTTFHVTSDTTVYWKVTFVSSDSTIGSSSCVEQSILTIDNDNTAP
jgi:hypothetical protein